MSDKIKDLEAVLAVHKEAERIGYEKALAKVLSLRIFYASGNRKVVRVSDIEALRGE